MQTFWLLLQVRQPQGSRPLRAGLGASSLKLLFNHPDIGKVTARQVIHIKKAYLIKGCVVKARNKEGGMGYSDALVAQMFTHCGIIKQPRQCPGVHFTSLATAGAALQACLVRIVSGLATMAYQQHNGGKATAETHRDKYTGGNIGTIFNA